MPPSDANDLFDSLTRILEAQIECHGEMLHCLAQAKESIRTADVDAVAESSEKQQAILVRIQQLDQSRAQLVSRLSQVVGFPANDPTLEQVAAAADEPHRGTLLELTQQLRDVVGSVTRDSGVMRHAAESLCRHMAGIAQTVHHALGRAGVYGRKGVLAPGNAILSCIDLKS